MIVAGGLLAATQSADDSLQTPENMAVLQQQLPYLHQEGIWAESCQELAPGAEWLRFAGCTAGPCGYANAAHIKIWMLSAAPLQSQACCWWQGQKRRS